MATDARVAMYMRRGEDFTFLVRVRGPDISGSTFRMQVRDRAGTPGAALISLARVTDDSAGLGVIDTRVVAGVIETIVRIRVPAALTQMLPYAPVIGAQKQLAFGFMIDGRTRLFGDLFVLDSAIDSDAAPLNRSASALSPVSRDAGGVQQGLTLTIAQDSVVDLTIDGADLLGPLATRAIDAIDTVEGIATTSYRAVATYGEREAIPLDKRAPGMLVRVLEGSTEGGRVFIWNPDFAMPGAWTGLLNEEEKMRLDLMHGGLGQDKVYGLTGSLDAIRDANAAIARVKVGNLRAELLAGGAATIAWTRDGARPDAQEVAWGDWSVPLSGDVERFDLHDWSKIDRLFVAGNSLSDTTGGNGQWSQLLAQQLGVPLVSVARGSSDARQVYKMGARPLLLTLGGQLPANGSAAVTLINGVAPSLDSYVSPASFLNSYGGDATPASMTGYVTDGTTSRRVTVSIARSDSTDYRITQAAGGGAVTFAGPVLFTPDTVIEPARSLNGLWVGNNYFYSGVPGAYGDNTNAQLWTDMAAIVRKWNGARGFILPILPSTDWVARGPGTPYDAYIAANARTRSLYPRYWLTDAQGRDLIAYVLQVGSDGSAGDRDDVAKGFTPRSCRYDGLHLNAKGVGLVVAFLLAALPRQAMPPVLAEGMTVRLNASGAGTADSAIAQVVRPASAALIDGVVSQSAYRPTLAAAVADFEVGTFFVSRDMDGVTAYPGEKRQYEIIAQAPYWADRGPFVGKADVGLDAVDNTSDEQKVLAGPISDALTERPTHEDLAGAAGAEGLGWKLAASQAVTRAQASKNADVKNFADFAYSGDKSNNRAFADMLEYLGGIAPVAGNKRYLQRPVIQLNEGAVAIEYDRSFDASIAALALRGHGKRQSALRLFSNADVPFLDSGAFNPVLTGNVYDGDLANSDLMIEGLRLTLENPGAPGARRGQAIRQTRGGGIILREVALQGFKYGLNSVAGGDFCRFEGLEVEYCDVGAYLGPGGQQITSLDFNAFYCEEAIVMDRIGEARFFGTTINSPGKSGVVIECLGPSKTRQLDSFPVASTSLQSMISFIGNWWESDAAGDGRGVPDQFVEFRSDATQPDAYRDITFANNKLLIAPAKDKAVSAFLAKTGTGPGGQRITIENTVCSGNLAAVHSAPMGAVIVRRWRTENGYTPAKISEGQATSTFRLVDDFANRRRQGAGPYDDEVTNIPPGSRVDIKSDFPADWTVALRRRFTGARLAWAMWNAALPGYDPAATMGFDLSRRLVTLGDPEAVNPLAIGISPAQPGGAYAQGSFSFGGAPVVAALPMIGYQRLTSGTGNALYTDWLPVFGKSKAFDDTQDAVLDVWGVSSNTRAFVEVRNAGLAPTPRPVFRGIQVGGALGFTADPNSGLGGVALNLFKAAQPAQPSSGWKLYTDQATGKVTAYGETAYGNGIHTLHLIRSGSKVYDPPSIATGSSVSTTVTVGGAVLGEKVVGISHSAAGFGGLLVSGSVTAADTVTVVLANLSGAAIDLATGTLGVDVARGAS